jgi:hypothetical protein
VVMDQRPSFQPCPTPGKKECQKESGQTGLAGFSTAFKLSPLFDPISVQPFILRSHLCNEISIKTKRSEFRAFPNSSTCAHSWRVAAGRGRGRAVSLLHTSSSGIFYNKLVT